MPEPQKVVERLELLECVIRGGEANEGQLALTFTTPSARQVALALDTPARKFVASLCLGVSPEELDRLLDVGDVQLPTGHENGNRP